MAKKKKHPGGRPVKYNNCMDFDAMCEIYFEFCDKADRPYTMAGLALGLGLSHQGLTEYSAKPEFSALHARAKLRIEDQWSRFLFGKGTAHGAQFALKHHYGWRDKQEIENTNYNLDMTDDELQAKAKELLERAKNNE